jgi:hypothetical protein
MTFETALVTAVLSLGLVVIVCGLIAWVAGKRRRRWLPPPERACDRDWYSVGRDAK